MIAPKHTKPIIVIIGPTATNKTRVSMELAKKFNGEIINADAFQVYREMQVGVNKPTTQEMQTNKFHLIGCVSINDK
jgi:tRNA dimethylallyltransferase